MSDTPETDLLCGEVVPAKFARLLERERNEARQKLSEKVFMGEVCIASREYIDGIEKERDELLQVIRDVDWAFPDLAEFQDKDGRSLKWLADKIQKAKGEA
jgi:hypothetical protein